MPQCPECAEFLSGAGLSCAACGWSQRKGTKRPPPVRAEYLRPRPEDPYCRIHKIALDPTGWCEFAQAWWVPKFACPRCHAWLRDDGYCASCTPKTETFPGDFFAQRWDSLAGREWGHYVRVYAGPTAAPTRAQIDGYLAELHALVQTTADALDANGQGTNRRLRGCKCDRCVKHFAKERQPGDEPAWVTEEA